MKTTQTTFTPEDLSAAAQAVAAQFGRGGAMEICKTYARGGLQALKTFEAATAAYICAEFGLKPGMSLASIDALKRDARFVAAINPKGSNPATTIYTYCLKLRPIAGKHAEIDALTVGEATGGKGKGNKGKTDKPEAPKAETRPLTADDCIAFLQGLHQSVGLSVAQYAALQAMIPAPARSNVIDMGAAVEVAPALLAA